MLRLFFYLHLVGLTLIGIGLYFLLFTEVTQTVNGMIAASSALGIGGVMISPYPVIKFIQWSQHQGNNS